MATHSKPLSHGTRSFRLRLDAALAIASLGLAAWFIVLLRSIG